MQRRHSFLVLTCLWLAITAARAATLPAGFSESLVANGLSSPTAMDFAPDGRLFVCQQGGTLRVIKNDVLLATPFVTVTTDASGERGLLGVAFDPDFVNHPWVYVYYTVPGSPAHNRVSRFTANGDVAVPGSEVILLELNGLSGASNHNGGAIHFGPDGMLYVAVGDNANSANAQTLGNLLGKVLRLNADGSIPTSNPFYNSATGVNRAIWALGLRNPFTFAHRPGSSLMFINDVGQSTTEEIDRGVAGANYGWPTCEGACAPPTAGLVDPVYQYPHSGGACAITGGTFYNPAASQFPAAYVGLYFFADYCAGWIRTLDPASPSVATTFATGLSNPTDLKVSADGSLYYMARGVGSVYRVLYAGAPSITGHPQDRTAPVGGSATFSVAASGAPPLAYQWQRDDVDIPGAISSSYIIAGVQLSDNGAQFRCRVSNAQGSVTSNSALLTVDNNEPPVATILTPARGASYDAGGTIAFTGDGTDIEDGNLPPTAFRWLIEFHHDAHTHPFLGPIDGTEDGEFVVPTSGETAANVFYRIHLTVTDSDGATGSTFVDVVPNVVRVTLTTDPMGLELTLDGQPVLTPYAFDGVVGMTRTLGAPTSQRLGKTNYTFANWSDGGAQTHVIATPSANATVTAVYRKKARR